MRSVLRTDGLPHVDFRDPGAVVSAMNNVFLMRNQNNLYFTLWFGVFHAPTRKLRFACAGHPPALLLPPLAAVVSARWTRRTPVKPVGVEKGDALPAAERRTAPLVRAAWRAEAERCAAVRLAAAV